MQWGPLLVALISVPVVWGADWPQYLGSQSDNTSPESVRTYWTQVPPKEVWRRSIGPGFSSLVVASGRGFTQARKTSSNSDREVCLALDVSTGKTLWETDVDAADYSDLSGYDNRMDGPRSTPAIDGDRVYVATSQLKLFCLDAATGNVIWRRDFQSELGSNNIPWENAASPLVVGDLIYVNANASGRRLMALRKSDGTTAWGVQDDGLTHATPVYATLTGVPQVIFLTRQGLAGLAPDDGTVLWRLGFSPSSTSTAASPAVAGEYVYGSAAYASGTWVAHVTKSGTTFKASQVARQQGTSYQAHWSTPVHHEGFLYCVPAPSSGQGRLACLDPAGGTNRWTQSQVGSGALGYGSLIKAANTLIVLTESGELVLVQPNPSAYSEIARYKALTAYCWNHPTLSNGRLFARSTSLSPEIVALDIGADAPQIPPLSITAEMFVTGASGTLRLTVHGPAGTDLDPAAASQVELRRTDKLQGASTVWTRVDAALAASNGAWVVEVPIGTDPVRFLRVQQVVAGN